MLDRFSLQGKKAIVTGGARGLGYAATKGLHQSGAEVLMIGRSEEGGKTAAALSSEEAPVHYVKGDLSVLESLSDVFQQAVGRLNGKVDILVNGAGIQHRCPAAEFPLDRWQQIMDTNLNGVFVFSQLAGRLMLEQGSGRIINIASMTSFFGSELIPAYAASKGAVVQLTKALSNEWAHRGVNVNAIAPGYMETELTADMKDKNPGQYQEITSRIPMHRWGKPDDIKGLVVFLAGEMSAYITGAVIPVDGGYLGK